MAPATAWLRLGSGSIDYERTMTTSDERSDSLTAVNRRARVWRALAVVLGVLVILETAVLLREFARSPEPTSLTVSVPDLVGRRIDDARAIVDAVGLELQSTGRVSNRPIATVLEQDPRPGTRVAHGDPVRVVIATAATDVVVPDLLGVPEPEAQRLLSAAGLVAGSRTETPAPAIAEGAVASQDPAAGTRVPRGTPVSYAVATNASPSPVPAVTSRPSPLVSTPQPPVGGIPVGDYRCMVLPEAEAHIRDDGFAVGRISYSVEGGPVDDTWAVTRQDPPARSTAAPGATIDILLSSPFGTCARNEGS